MITMLLCIQTVPEMDGFVSSLSLATDESLQAGEIVLSLIPQTAGIRKLSLVVTQAGIPPGTQSAIEAPTATGSSPWLRLQIQGIISATSS